MEALRPGDPRHVGGYRILARLGAGGMGQVFLARSRAGREVALKLVHAALADDPEFRARFRREVTAARAVSGAFTASVIGADPDAPVPWLATDYLRGMSLHRAVALHGPLPLPGVIALAAGLAEALVAIHTAGVVHRDLKPSNVLLTSEGPRVIDFGIARAADGAALTATGSAVGSPGYMAPEQVSGTAEADTAADVFALGAVLGYAATGANPFGRGPADVLLYRVLRAEPDLGAVEDAELRGLIARCLDREPGRRPTPDRILSELAPRAPAPEALLGTTWLPDAFSADIDRTPAPPPPVTAGTSFTPSRRAVLTVGASGLAGIAVTALGITLAKRLGGGDLPERSPSSATGSTANASATESAAVQWRREVPVTDIGGLAIAEGVVLVSGGSNGVHALDAATGARRWQVPLQPESSGIRPFLPLVSGGTAYLRDGRTVSAVGLETGEVRWTHPFPAGSGQHQAVMAAGRLVVAVSEAEAVAFDPDTGERRWATPVRRPEDAAALSGNLLCVVVPATGGRQVQALDVRDGRTRWRRTLGGYSRAGGVTAGDGAVYTVGDGRIHALAAAGGEVRWSTAVGGTPRLKALPTVAGQSLYLEDREGFLHCFDARTGKRAWKQAVSTTGEARDGLGLYGLLPLTVAGLVVVHDHGGSLLALDQGTGRVFWRVSAEDPLGRPPALTSGSLHVRGVNTVITVQVASGRILREEPAPLTRFVTAVGDMLYLAGDGEVTAMRPPAG
ncbi:PQQ-binding-like beta-propeller repeat protein [Planomonospora sp. ID67723]|uniref:outer membrane protein assembly factor BamB family protein n=1 Tax=Planomonospora sp. ID67723 TaxID=2738134 RepID=UPI0018C38B05|nr:PQQ-binding-like beta-propeller repeat protein [Planomonospora sp. ID67723]MBG0829202.1 PQQ-binding-like beta-propeller repeat protein [Planomonospora sp. ID67723]